MGIYIYDYIVLPMDCGIMARHRSVLKHAGALVAKYDVIAATPEKFGQRQRPSDFVQRAVLIYVSVSANQSAW